MPPQGQELLTKLASSLGSALKPADIPAPTPEAPAAAAAPAPTPVEAKPAKRV
jgi:hypothetical protein